MWIGSRVMSTPGEVAADVDDLAQRLERALARHLGDVERDRAVPKPRPSLISVCSARETTSRERELHLVGRVLLHEALALGVVEVRALAARALRDEDPVPASVVGWYWIISMSISGAPMR
jgi:hypothetical protein